MADYQQTRDQDGNIAGTVLRRADNAYIPDDPANRDRQEYDLWLEEGNQPDPPDPLPEPAAPEPVTLPAAMPEDPLHAVPKAYVDELVQPILDRLAALERRLV